MKKIEDTRINIEFTGDISSSCVFKSHSGHYLCFVVKDESYTSQ